MADIDISIGLTADTSVLGQIESEINSLKKETIDLNFNHVTALNQVKSLAKQFEKYFNIPMKIDFKNNSDLRRYVSEMSTMFKHLQTAVATGMNLDNIDISSGKLNVINRQLANAFKNQSADIISNLQKQYSDMDISMPALDSTKLEQSVTNAAKNIKKLQEKSQTMLQDGVMTKLGEKYGNTEAFKKLQQGMDAIDWSDFTTGFERAQQLLTTFGQEAGVQFTELRQDAVQFVDTMDNVTNAINTFNLDKTDSKSNLFEHIEESAKSTQKAFDVVVNGADALKKSLNENGNYDKMLDFITDSLKKAGVELDSLGGNVDAFLQNVQTRFDKTGQLVSASISGTVNDITMAWNMGANEQGGLAFGTASITDRTQSNAIQTLASNYKELLSLKKQLAQLESKGYTDEAADVKNTISALDNENESLKQLINNKQKVQQLTDDYTASLSRQTAHQNDVAREAEDAEKVEKYTSAMKEALQVQSEINSIRTSGDTTTQQYADLQQRMQSLVTTLKDLGVSYDMVTNKFSSSGVDKAIADITETEKAYKKLSQEQEKFQQKSDDAAQSMQTERDQATLERYVTTLKKVREAQSLIASKEGKGDFNTEQIAQAQSTIQSFIPVLEKLGITYDEVTNSFNVDTSNMSFVNGLVQTPEIIEKVISKLKEFKQQTETAQSSQADTRMNNTYNKAVEALNKVIAKRKELAQAEKSGSQNTSGLERMRQDLQQLETEAEQAEQALKDLNNEARSASFDKYKENSMKELDSDLDKIKNSTQEANDGFSQLGSTLTQFAAMVGIFDGIQQDISSAKEEIVELNTVMTELQIVMEASDTTMQNTMSNYADMAKDLGVTLQTVAEGAGEWLNVLVTINPLNCWELLRDYYTTA